MQKRLAALFVASLPFISLGLRAEEARDKTAAVVAGTSVTLSAVDQMAKDRLARLRQEEYAARRQALEEYVVQTLLDKEAAARGVSFQELTKAEVEDKTSAPTDAEKKSFYEENKPRLGGKSYEDALPILEPFLKQQNLVARRTDFVRSLKNKYGVKVLLDVDRVAVDPSDDPSKGPKDAPVTIVEFSDFQCPHCSRVEEVLKKVAARYKKEVRVVFRDYPLPIHKDASRAAEAAACASEQGKYWPMHEKMFQNQDKLSLDGLKGLAVQAGLKKDSFAKCLDSGKYAAEWQKDMEDGRAAGVTGTPSFFINGRMLWGFQSFEAFSQAIDDELLALGRPLPGAAPAAPAAKGKKK